MRNSGAVAWLFTGLASAVALAYAVVLALGPPNMTAPVLDFSAKLIGPLGAALIAWAGVSHTVLNSRLQDKVKEWHQDLRWATELCASSDSFQVAVGIAVLDELDGQPFLEPEQVKMVNRIADVAMQKLFSGVAEERERRDSDAV